jgi:FMN phosphatase YigB (HAD superfamily)
MIKKVVLILCLLTVPIGAKNWTILWDLGGPLFNPDKLGVAREIGLSNFIKHAVGDLKNPNVQRRLFELLSMLDTEEQKKVPHAGTAEGDALPGIMCAWQAGTLTGTEIIAIVHRHLTQLYKKGKLYSKREYILLKKTVQAMFDPTILARNIRPIEAGVQLLKECYFTYDTNGIRKHRLIAFSNWDHLSFDQFYERNKDIFAYFDAVIISGHIKLIKPHKEAYQYVLETCHLDPKKCILIDDQKINIDTARSCGITPLLVNGNYGKLRKQLVQLRALPRKPMFES